MLTAHITARNYCKMKKVKVIMIDAFRPEYLNYAPYLASLTNKFQWGELEMPIGHGGGIETFFRGESKVLATFYKKENSSLRWIRSFIFLEKFGKIGRLVIDCLINFLRFVEGKELHKTGKIPLRQLWKMEMNDSKKAYKNLEIEYFYISELDKVGHKYGPESEEIRKAVREVDRKISTMNFDMIFSDHGMMEVKKVVSIPETEDCMIESDMARFWGKKPVIKIKEGKWIEWPDKSYGDYIFLANPGVLIFPNYWNYSKIKGMHGYDGKTPEMKGIYIIKREGKRKDLRVRELHLILKEMLKKLNVY